MRFTPLEEQLVKIFSKGKNISYKKGLEDAEIIETILLMRENKEKDLRDKISAIAPKYKESELEIINPQEETERARRKLALEYREHHDNLIRQIESRMPKKKEKGGRQKYN